MKTASEKRLKILYYSVNLTFLGIVVIMNIFGIVVGVEEFIKYLHHQMDFNWCIFSYFLFTLVVAIFLTINIFKSKYKNIRKRCMFSFAVTIFFILYIFVLLNIYAYFVSKMFFDCRDLFCVLCGK